MVEATSTQLGYLITRLQAGDPTARNEVVAQSCERMQRLARRLLRDFPRLQRWEDAEDVVQNAAIRLLRSLQAVTPNSVAGYFTLAAREIRRELIDLTRHHFGPEGHGAGYASVAAAGESETPAPALAPPQSTLDPARLATWTEFHRRVEALPLEEREVFDLLWYHELAQEEAASALEVSLATLKRRWMAARLRLQEVLQELPPSD